MGIEWWIIRNKKDKELEVAAYVKDADEWSFLYSLDSPNDEAVQKYYEKIKQINLEKLIEDE